MLTDAAFARMCPLGDRWADGVQSVIDEHDVPWSVSRLGARAEYWFLAERPRDGGTAAKGVDHDLDAFMHLYALNRGILLTPFHNMALMSPATTEADVDRHTEVFAAAVGELLPVSRPPRAAHAAGGDPIPAATRAGRCGSRSPCTPRATPCARRRSGPGRRRAGGARPRTR